MMSQLTDSSSLDAVQLFNFDQAYSPKLYDQSNAEFSAPSCVRRTQETCKDTTLLHEFHMAKINEDATNLINRILKPPHQRKYNHWGEVADTPYGAGNLTKPTTGSLSATPNSTTLPESSDGMHIHLQPSPLQHHSRVNSHLPSLLLPRNRRIRA
jgi:hypothetical protein